MDNDVWHDTEFFISQIIWDFISFWIFKYSYGKTNYYLADQTQRYPVAPKNVVDTTVGVGVGWGLDSRSSYKPLGVLLYQSKICILL